MSPALDPLEHDDAERTELLVQTLTSAFEDLMRADPGAFRTKFRTMAADPFAFYRGSACLYYADVVRLRDRWTPADAPGAWIQGDLHAENFGTYMDSGGRLVFDVNDFDEAYLAPWAWDLQRFVASVALLAWRKALPDSAIDDMVASYTRGYVDQVRYYTTTDVDTGWALTLQSATGAVLDALNEAKLSTRVALLDRVTVVDGYTRRFAERSGVRRLDDDERERVMEAYHAYLGTIPDDKRTTSAVDHEVLDVVGKSGFGIGSAGLPAYSVLIEGFTQALDNDVVLTMKQGNVAAASRVVDVPQGLFEHHGHRTALSQRALQAHADRFLGWTSLDTGRGPVGFVVAEFSPYEADLDWDALTEPDELVPLVEQLGRATAKVHCVSDDDSEHGIVDVSVEETVSQAVGDDADALVRDMQAFAHAYGERARADHALFVDAFRAGAFAEVTPTTT